MEKSVDAIAMPYPDGELLYKAMVSNSQIRCMITNREQSGDLLRLQKSLHPGTPLEDDCQITKFPWRLHEMLDDAEVHGFSHVVSWLPGNKSFKVHQADTFTNFIMPRYFRQTKFKSFRRQINMWSFKRIGSGPDKGGYRHEYFIRGKPNLCMYMKRTKVKGCSRPLTTLSNNSSDNGRAPCARIATSTTTSLGKEPTDNLKYDASNVMPWNPQSDFMPTPSDDNCDRHESWYQDHEALLWMYACHAIDLPQKHMEPTIPQDEIRNELISTFTLLKGDTVSS